MTTLATDSFTVGSAVFHKGAPPKKESDTIDDWFRSLLTYVETPSIRNSIYGSDAGKCARLNVLHANNRTVANPVSATAAAYMRIGSALEDLLVNGLYQSGKLISSNYWIIPPKELKIGGKIDIVMVDPKDKVAIVEVKTCGELPTEPKWVHLQQIQTYAAISGFNRAYLTYISRSVTSGWDGKLKMITFDVPTDSVVIFNRLYTASLSQICIKEGVLPPKSPHFRKTVECSYCPFIPICWESEPAFVPEVSPIFLKELEGEATVLAKKLLEERPARFSKTIENLIEDALSEKTIPYLKKELKP